MEELLGNLGPAHRSVVDDHLVDVSVKVGKGVVLVGATSPDPHRRDAGSAVWVSTDAGLLALALRRVDSIGRGDVQRLCAVLGAPRRREVLDLLAVHEKLAWARVLAALLDRDVGVVPILVLIVGPAAVLGVGVHLPKDAALVKKAKAALCGKEAVPDRGRPEQSHVAPKSSEHLFCPRGSRLDLHLHTMQVRRGEG